MDKELIKFNELGQWSIEKIEDPMKDAAAATAARNKRLADFAGDAPKKPKAILSQPTSYRK